MPITDVNGQTHYGGRQNWFIDENKFSADYIIKKYGCGTIAASDLFLYLALQNNNYENIITGVAIKNNTIGESNYLRYVRTINYLYTKTPRFTGVPGPAMKIAINKYFKYADIDYKASWPMSLDKEKMNYINIT